MRWTSSILDAVRGRSIDPVKYMDIENVHEEGSITQRP